MYFLTLCSYGVANLRMPDAYGMLPYGVPILAVAWIALLCSWIHGVPRLPRRTRFVLYAVILYSLGAFMSVWGGDQVDYLLVFKICVFPSVIVLVVLVQHKIKDLQAMLVGLSIGGAALTLYGLYGYLGGDVGTKAERALGYFGITYAPATRNSDVLYIIVPFWCLVGALWSGYGINGSLARKIVAWLALSGLGMALVESYVRGIWLTICITVVFGGVLLMKPRAKVAAAVCVVLLVLIAVAASKGLTGNSEAVPSSVDKLAIRARSIVTLDAEVPGSNSNENRLELLSASLRVGVDASPLGIGVGQLRYIIGDRVGFVANHAENMFVQAFVENGWLSLFGLLWICKLCVGGRLDPTLGVRERFLKGTCRLIGVNLVLYGMVNLLLDSLWFWSVVAVCCAVHLETDGRRKKWTLRKLLPSTSREKCMSTASEPALRAHNTARRLAVDLCGAC